MDGFLESEKHTDLHTTQVQQHNDPPRVHASIPEESPMRLTQCVSRTKKISDITHMKRLVPLPPPRCLAWATNMQRNKQTKKLHEDHTHFFKMYKM